MDEQDWLIIKLLYKNKSITKTAKDLFMAQPTLTAHMRKIEEDMGVTILHRSNRGVKFTPEGEYLAECAEKMLLNSRQIRETVANLDNELKGTLRIGASIYVTRYVLPRLLRVFKDKYPDIEFYVMTTASKDIFGLMRSQDCQIGFVRSDQRWRDGKVLLFEEPMCIASKNRVELKDLPKLPRINYRSDPLNTVLLNRWWSEKFSEPPFVKMVVDQVDICRDMVLNDLGYAILPSLMLNDVKDIHKLYITDKTGQRILRKTWLLYQEQLLEHNLVRSFVHFVKKLEIDSIL
ncbi:LysR family transcriptional regulator [Acetonema longum]|uniref:Transcriptional regulator n=1 Tax=Acetonema longum DSM 6540 TaxID=1009370 RepID=F7NGK6_9FIRM|nr:LysR family transcriptional regulator [Acetonema longum]EGO64810.1 transcriptional regulator [Acetonema longum DSM 6540]